MHIHADAHTGLRQTEDKTNALSPNVKDKNPEVLWPLSGLM